MNNETHPSFKDPGVIFLSFFGVGFAPYAPGTWGTLATLPFLYALGLLNPPKILFIPFILILTILSCFVADMTQRHYQTHDPSWIVMDEVLGMAVAWLFVSDPSIISLISATILFRFFDIAKPWPISFFDSLSHGAGTILDDIIAGIYAGLTYTFLCWILPSITLL